MLAADYLALLEKHGLEADRDNGPIIGPDDVIKLAKPLREELDFAYFVYCAAVHYLEEGEEPEHIIVAYRVRRFGPNGGDAAFRVRIPVDGETPSLAGLWVGADWQEREQYDLVGAKFSGHPDLRRLMMPEDWEGHPLRRDYAIDTPHHPWR